MSDDKLVAGIPAKFQNKAERAKFVLDFYGALLCEGNDFVSSGELLKDLKEFYEEQQITFTYGVFDEKVQ